MSRCVAVPTHLSVAKTTLSLDQGHDLESAQVDLQILLVDFGHLRCRTPSAAVRLAPNSA